MKILIDTNVIMDVLIKREPFYGESAKDFPSIGIKIISPAELLKRLEKVNKPKLTD